MKFQDFSFNGLKVTVGTKSVTHPRTHPRSQSNIPYQLFQSWGHNQSLPVKALGVIVRPNSNKNLEVLKNKGIWQGTQFLLVVVLLWVMANRRCQTFLKQT